MVAAAAAAAAAAAVVVVAAVRDACSTNAQNLDIAPNEFFETVFSA